MTVRYRVGRKLGRTVYRDDELIGVMDTPELGALVAEALNEHEQIRREVTHACPIGDAVLTPCCNRTPFELPRTDRMTLNPALITCRQETPDA